MSKAFDKRIILLFSGRVVQSLLAVIAIRVLTGILSQQEVGNQYLINSIILWFSLVLINPVGMFVNRHLHEWKSKNLLYAFFRQLNIYFVSIALISLPVVFVARNFFGIGELLPVWNLVFFILGYIFFSTWFQTIVSVFNLFDFQGTFVLLNILAQGFGLVLAILGVKFVEPTALVWMLGLLLGQVVSLILAMRLFRNYFPKPKDAGLQESETGLFSPATLKFCFPIAITTLFMWFMNQGYRLIVERNMGAEVLASVGVGLGLTTSLAGVIESLVTQYLYPRYYAALADSTLEQRRLAWEDLWTRTIAVYVPFCFLLIAVSVVVVRLLTAQTFYHVVYFLWFGAFIELFRQLSNIAYLVSHAEKKTHNTIIPYAIGGCSLAVFFALAVVFNYLSLNVLLVALVLAGFLTYVANLVVVKKLINCNLNPLVPLKSAILMLPVLVSLYFVSVETGVLVLIAVAGLSGGWFLAVVAYMLKGLAKAD